MSLKLKLNDTTVLICSLSTDLQISMGRIGEYETKNMVRSLGVN